jgi:hypothetical protein
MINVDILRGVQFLYDPLFTSLGYRMRLLLFLLLLLLLLLLLALLGLSELSAIPQQCGALIGLGGHCALQPELSVGVRVALELVWWLLNVLNLTG